MSFPRILGKLTKGFLFVGILVLIFVLSGAIATWLFLKNEVQGKVVAAPDLFDISENDARVVCSQSGLLMSIDANREHSQLVEAGKVLLQVPREGRLIKAGRTIEVTLSAGPEQRTVPEMEGETLTFSQALLEESGMQAAIISRAPSQSWTKGRIMAQVPLPGGELGVLQGTSLLVSDGVQKPFYVMPKLLGRDYLTVKSFLDREDFRVITKYRVKDEDLGQVVLEQWPRAGYPIAKNQTVTLIVNKDF